jgi:hypothetical protein
VTVKPTRPHGAQKPLALRPLVFKLDADGNEISHHGPGRAARRRDEHAYRQMVGREKARRHVPLVGRLIFRTPPYVAPKRVAS